VGPSDAVTGNLARAGIPRGKLRTVYNGIDLERFDVDGDTTTAVRRDLGIEPGQLAVGLFGQMLPYKGHGTLIDAAPAILRRVPGARFYFVGALENPPYQAKLQRRIDEAGLSAAFRFTGWRADIPAVLRAMDVLSVLTVTPEPAALGLMEAMAASRPVVATRTGGTPEIVTDGETGRIVPPGDAAATATAIAELLEEEALRARFGAAGRRRVERDFTRDAHLASMLQIYHEGYAGSGRSRSARTSA
jgi:glycosyltransferase involved in cell wall biosynthesis